MVAERGSAGFLSQAEVLRLGEREKLRVTSDGGSSTLLQRAARRATELRLGREPASMSRIVLHA